MHGEDFPFDPGDVDVLVEMGQWFHASEAQTIGTFALGPCVGLAVYDPGQRQGFMTHTTGHETQTIEEMLGQINSEGRNLQAWLSGALLRDRKGQSMGYDTIRDDVVQLLRGLGIPEDAIKISWIDSEDKSTDMVLDCSNGNCTIFSYPLE